MDFSGVKSKNKFELFFFHFRMMVMSAMLMKNILKQKQQIQQTIM